MNRGLRVRLKQSDWVADGWKIICQFSGNCSYISRIFGHEKRRDFLQIKDVRRGNSSR